MPRRLLTGDAGTVFHAMNRARKNTVLFDRPKAYRAFVELMAEAADRSPVPMLAYCLMPNHWHFIFWPRHERDITTQVGWLTMTHAKRFRAFTGTTGSGPVYRGPFKVTAVTATIGLYRVIRYVERNPVRAGLVARAEEWPWSSARRHEARIRLAEWPVPRPAGWLSVVNDEEKPQELELLRAALHGEDSSAKRKLF